MSASEQGYDHRRFQQLLDAKCNGSITDVEVRELEKILMASPQAREDFWESMKVHSDLGWELASATNWGPALERLLGSLLHEDEPEELNKPAPTEKRAATFTRSGLFLAVAGCLLVGTVIGIRALLNNSIAILNSANERSATIAMIPDEAQNGKKALSRNEVLGRLTPLVPSSQWTFGRRTDRDTQEVLRGDTLSIDVGAVELKLANNVVANMRAPLVLQVVSVEQVRLLHGRIQVDVPDGAEGFSVDTATAEIVDLGTSFSVEVADGGTDLIVHQGEVDLKVADKPVIEPEDDLTPGAIKRFRGGEAVHVDRDGTLARIVNVHPSSLSTEEDATYEGRLIESVSDNLTREDIWSFYEIVPGGFNEDAKAFVDRPHEWNGATEHGLPSFLVGADYVKTFNNDKVASELNIKLELKKPAIVFVLLDQRLIPPKWLTERFLETGSIVGIDEAHNDSQSTFVGAGKGIDETFSVWKFEAVNGGTVDLGPNGHPEILTNEPIKEIPSNMYGIAVVGID